MNLTFTPPLSSSAWTALPEHLRPRSDSDLSPEDTTASERRLTAQLGGLFGAASEVNLQPIHSQGLSGDVVIKADYREGNHSYACVIKVPGSPSSHLGAETNAYSTYSPLLPEGNKRVQLISVGIGAVAYRYAANSKELKAFLSSDGNSIEVIRKKLKELFTALKGLHGHDRRVSIRPFHTTFVPTFDPAMGDAIVKKFSHSWSILQSRFKDYRRIECICHGDLNPRNVLIPSASESPLLIDFAKTGIAPCSVDFVRLEREVRHFFHEELAHDICKIADREFELLETPREAQNNPPLLTAVQIIREIRLLYRQQFNPQTVDHTEDELEVNYLCCLVCDQLKLFRYEPWKSDATKRDILAGIIGSLINRLLWRNPQRFAFGTLVVNTAESEQWLLKIDDDKCSFPVAHKLQENDDMREEFDQAFWRSLITSRIIENHELIRAGFDRLKVSELLAPAHAPFLIAPGDAVRPCFGTIELSKCPELSLSTHSFKNKSDLISYKWVGGELLTTIIDNFIGG